MGELIPFPTCPWAAVQSGQAVQLDDGRSGTVLRVSRAPGGAAESVCVIVDHIPTVISARTVTRVADSLKGLHHAT